MGKRKRTSWGGLARKMAKLGNLLDVVATGEGQSQEEADQDIQKLEGVKTYPVHLTEHLLNPKRSLEVRLLASEKLILNVKAHWCSTEKGFLPPEVDSRNKEKIKTLLIKGLRESPKEVILLPDSTHVAGVLSLRQRRLSGSDYTHEFLM